MEDITSPQSVSPDAASGATGNQTVSASPDLQDSNPPVVSAPQVAFAPVVDGSPVVGTAPVSTIPQIPVETDEKVWAALSYLPLMATLALVVKPKSEFVRLHGRQGLFLFGMFVAGLVGFAFLLILLPSFLSEFLISPLWILYSYIALPALGVYSLYQALIGNWWEIPVLGALARKIPVGKYSHLVHEAVTGQPVGDESNQENDSPSNV